MKLASPVHFVAGFVEAIASDAQRTRPSIVASSACPMPPKFIASIMHAPGSPKRNRTTVRAHAVAIPHPSGNAVAGRAVTGMKIKGMPTFRIRARVWFDELATGPRIDGRKRLSTGVTFARPVDGRL